MSESVEPENSLGIIDQQEDESDLIGIGAISYRDSVIMNTDWTVETLYIQIKKGNIDLQPNFQRRAAWDEIRKSRLIESIIVGMPVPNIVIAENKQNKGRFIVIDGKQRLISISDFFENRLELKGLDIRTDLNGKKMNQLEQDDKESLENSTIRSSQIKNWRDDKFLYAIFYRLNSGSLPLSPQELRKALVGGKLIDRIENYIENSAEFREIFGELLDKRMRDSELVIRYVAFEIDYQNYDGNLKNFLDNVTDKFENAKQSEYDKLDNILSNLNKSLETSKFIFGDNVFRKWIGDKFEKRVNRALFDCVTRFFSQTTVADAANSNKDEVLQKFKVVCGNQEFKDAVERTTKSIVATRARINIWGQALSEVLNMRFDATIGRII